MGDAKMDTKDGTIEAGLPCPTWLGAPDWENETTAPASIREAA